MTRSSIIVCSVMLAIVWVPDTALSHAMAPSVLTFRTGADEAVTMIWRSPSTRPVGQHLVPQLPRGCALVHADEPALDESSSSIIQISRLRCDNPSLADALVRVDGLHESNVNVVVRVERPNQPVLQTLLSSDTPEARLPSPQRTPESSFGQYLQMGLQHLATGWDHILFVLGLVVLLGLHRPLLWAVTAFTVGHSLTLALASLGVVRIPTALVEILIAASLIAVALEILSQRQGPVARAPMALPAAFGLVHGLGFARVLTNAALPDGELVTSLLAFNLGIEAGQLVVVALVGALAMILRRLPIPKKMATVVPAYVIGSLGAFWILERTGHALGLVP